MHSQEGPRKRLTFASHFYKIELPNQKSWNYDIIDPQTNEGEPSKDGESRLRIASPNPPSSVLSQILSYQLLVLIQNPTDKMRF